MICRYCEIIHSFDKDYDLREASRDVKGDYPRCDWHWRFVCSICGRPKHFNGVAWCETTNRFICLSCATRHRFVKRRFWKWAGYYAVECDTCGEYHPALDYLESSGKHPWQLHPSMQKKGAGLDHESELPQPTSYYIPAKQARITDNQISKAWDKLAEKWNSITMDEGDLNRQHIVDPAILRILGPVNGLSILDAGCGNGYLCRMLAKRGAKMVGVDLSRRFIEIAEQKEREEPLGVLYYSGTLSNLEMLGNKRFDVVISNLALMDVLDLGKTMMEINRVLKENGRLIFSIMHPCFSSSPVHGWVRVPPDSQRKEDWVYWKVDRYFDRSVQVWQYRDWPLTYSFHRPLSDYIKMLVKNGFVITDFEEPVPSEQAMKEHYREFGNECDRIPWFLIVGCKKLRAKNKMFIQ